MINSKKVLVLDIEGYVNSVPSIMSAIQMFSENDWIVDILTLDTLPDPLLNCNSLLLYPVNKDSSLFLRKFRRRLLSIILPFYLFILSSRKKYDVVLSVDGWSLLYSVFIYGKTKTLYLVLHIRYLKELIKKKKYVKALQKIIETYLLKRLDAILIQDEYRRKSFVDENSTDELAVRYFVIPNSYRGVAYNTKTTHYAKKFSLTLEDKIILMAGSIQSWSSPEYLIQCAVNQNQSEAKYKLILQSRDILTDRDEYIKKLKALSNENVFYSLEPVSVDLINVAFSSAHIGVAIYNPTLDGNYAFVGGASGKMMSYLKNGLPVIMMDSPGVSEIINNYQCGKLLSGFDIGEFNRSVAEILDNYSFYTRNAVRCYNESYSFDTAFNGLLDFIAEPQNIKP